MSTVLNEPCGEPSNSSNEENEIGEIFSRHYKTLNSQMIMTIVNIETWRQRSIEYINKYADEQICILRDDYDRLRRDFTEKYEETRDIARAYHTAQQFDLFGQLRNQCRLLEFQVAQLENVQIERQSPKVITVEEQKARKQQEKLTTCQPENVREETSIIKDTNRLRDNGHENETTDSSYKSTSSIPIVTKRQLSTVESWNDGGRSKDSKHNLKPRAINDDDFHDKCPICYMIFPLRMTHDDRSQHVNEHYTSD